jgi:cell division septation protein DedD
VSAEDNGPWSVQVGSYPEKKIAEQSAKRLSDKGYDTYIVTSMIKDKNGTGYASVT